MKVGTRGWRKTVVESNGAKLWVISASSNEATPKLSPCMFPWMIASKIYKKTSSLNFFKHLNNEHCQDVMDRTKRRVSTIKRANQWESDQAIERDHTYDYLPNRGARVFDGVKAWDVKTQPVEESEGKECSWRRGDFIFCLWFLKLERRRYEISRAREPTDGARVGARAFCFPQFLIPLETFPSLLAIKLCRDKRFVTRVYVKCFLCASTAQSHMHKCAHVRGDIFHMHFKSVHLRCIIIAICWKEP